MEGREVLLLSCFSVKVCISYDTTSQVKLCKVNVPDPPRPSEPLHDLFHAVQKVPRGQPCHHYYHVATQGVYPSPT